MSLLTIKNLNAYYGKSHVLHGVDMQVNAGEIVSLLGRNGVGRSTTVKATMGQVDATGSILFKGEEIIGLKAFQIAHKGLGYVPENRDIFPGLRGGQILCWGKKSVAPRGGSRAGGRKTCIRCFRVCVSAGIPRQG